MANLIARPSDAELLAWLDGDLSPERRAEVVRLLELDWEVRAQLASLERCIEAYVRVVPPPPGEEPEPFDLVWSRLSPRLQVESGEKVPVSKRSDSASGMRRWLTAGLVAILAGGALLWAVLWQGRSVSAEEVLDRAVTGEARSGQGLAQPVIYRKLEVERLGAKPERILLESWKDLDHQRVRRRVVDRDGPRFLPASQASPPSGTRQEGSPPLLIDEVERILAASDFDPANPLSATAFADWRAGVPDRRDDIQLEGDRREGERIRLITSTIPAFTPGGIWQAALLVRRQDWHPVALSLSVGTLEAPTVFAFRELAYEVVPLEALTVFAEGGPTALTDGLTVDEGRNNEEKGERTLSGAAKAWLPSPEALRSAEVTALFTLHQMRADLGEQIEISRTERQVLVAGVVQSRSRRDELIDALRDLPLVRAEIRTLDEALASLPKETPNAPTSPVTPQVALTESEIAVASGEERGVTRPPILQQRLTDLLRAGGGGREADPVHAARWVAQSFTAIEADASGALSEARALFRLHENYREELAEPLTGAIIDLVARRRLDEMERNLLFRLRQRWRSLTGRLQPMLGPLPERVRIEALAPPVVEGSRRDQISRLFNAFGRSSRLADRLMVVSDASVFQSVAEGLLVELATIEWMLDHLEID
jgi:hypothetical protein